MKKVIIKINLIILLLCCISAGCKKSKESLSLLEINPNSQDLIIQKESNNIEFKFCLLNENGQPTTVFNIGENFIFSFSFKNKSQETISVTTEFINSDFFRVFLSQNSLDMGKPWTGVWCEFSGMPQEIKLMPDSSMQLSCPWILTEKNIPVYPLCMAESKDPLMQGEYYTKIDLNFHYSINGKETIINNLEFKINFILE